MSQPARPAPAHAHPAIQALLMAGEAAGRVSGEDLATALEALALEAAALGAAKSGVDLRSEESGVSGELQFDLTARHTPEDTDSEAENGWTEDPRTLSTGPVRPFLRDTGLPPLTLREETVLAGRIDKGEEARKTLQGGPERADRERLRLSRQVEDGEAARQGWGETLNRLARTARQLQRELNREATPEEIAEAVGACWDAARVPDAPKVAQEPVSLEVRTGHDVEQENF